MSYLFILLAYLLGSLPFGLILTKLTGGEDIRKIGSGNIGATNVLRTGKKGLAALTLLLDIAKGAIAVLLAYQSHDLVIVFGAALAVILGHIFPVFLKFKGGKGVATALGVLFALMPLLGLGVAIIWLLMALTFKISSLAALTGFAIAPLLSLGIWGDENLAYFCGLVAMLIFWKHKKNIERIVKGEEPRIGKK